MASYLFRNVLAVTGRTTADPSAARQEDNSECGTITVNPELIRNSDRIRYCAER
jgi:hypothetical protein